MSVQRWSDDPELATLMLSEAYPLITLILMTQGKKSVLNRPNGIFGHLPNSYLKNYWGDCSLLIFTMDLAIDFRKPGAADGPVQ